MSSVRITASSGRITVRAEARNDVEILRGRTGDDANDVRGGSDGVDLVVPAGTDLAVGTSSGRITLVGPLGRVSATTRSGKIEIEECAELDARTTSASVKVGRVHGDARVKTASGGITLGDVAGAMRASTVSSQIEVRAGGPTEVRTVSGSVTLVVTEPRDVAAGSVSGSVRIAVPAGSHPATALRSMSGSRSVEPDVGTDFEVKARSASGSLAVVYDS